MKTISISRRMAAVKMERGNPVAQTSKSAVSQVSKPANRPLIQRPTNVNPATVIPPLFPLFAPVKIFFSILFCAVTTSAQVSVPIGNLAPGETVTITFDVTLTNQFPSGVTSVTNQGTLSGDNFTAIKSDDPQTPLFGDPTITTVDVPPSVTTLAAGTIGTTNATLNGSVNPNGLAAGVWFQYGATTNYGASTGTNNGLVNVTGVVAPINGLAQGTLYHFRAVATNNAGLANGSDLTFTTTPIFSSLLKTFPLSNGQFRFAFTNTASQSFTVLASSNLLLPASNWTVLGTATENPTGSGQFQFTDLQATNTNRYYRLRWP